MLKNRSVKQSLEERVLDYIAKYDLVKTGTTILVTVSGGQDSVCLLHLLTKLKSKLGIDLHVAHLDHKLRGRESSADAQYVIDLCHRLGIPMTVEQRDVRAYQKEWKLSLEEAARDVRYQFFAEVAHRVGTKVVAVAHTKDDQVETILMHLIRGTGTKGLTGLQPFSQRKSGGKRLTIVRPLLDVSREETAAYCKRHRLEFRQDSTNLSLKPLRNKIRLELIPLLKTYNPGIVDALLRTSAIARDDIAFLESHAKHQWPKIVHKKAGSLVIEKIGFIELDRSRQRYILRLAMERLLATLKDIETRHIEKMMEAVEMPAGTCITMPEGLQFVVEYDRLILGRDIDNISPYQPLPGLYELMVPGTIAIPGWQVKTSIVNSQRKVNTDDPFTALLDFEKTGNELVIRTRKPGDRFQPLGMAESKKVGQFMIDNHVPRLWRSKIPIVLAGDKVVWVVGQRIDERFKVTDRTKKLLRLQFQQK